MKRREDDHRRPETVRNEATGSVIGPVVQARDIAGGIHFHQTTSLPPPNQLLPPPRLMGREHAIAALNSLRDDAEGAPFIALITGSAGVGKTALSLNWAHTVRPDHPDGQLYADLGGPADGAVVTPETVLGDFLYALGIPVDLIPGDLGQRAALYRTVTNDQRILVLLDDAISAAQVRPLLPASPGSTAVITSRYRLAGLLVEGARGIYLDHLEPGPALALLADSLGADRVARERDAAVELVRLCTGHPLALRVAAARLAARPNWPLSEMVAALTEEQRRLAALKIGDDMVVRSALDQSYRALRPDAARLYRLLGLVPGDTFGGDAAAALAALPRIEAGHLLGVLVDGNLLTDTPDGRHRFHHALIRLHAGQLTAAEDAAQAREDAVTRLLGWYLATAARAERRLRPHRTGLPRDAEPPPAEPTDFGDPEHALDWLAAERGNLGAAIAAAYEGGRYATAWQLTDAMWPLFLHRGHHADRLTVEETGLAATRACGDRYAEAKMLNRLGLSLHGLGRHDEALEHFGEARRLWSDLGERGREAGSLRRLGLVAAARGDRDEAIGYFLAACEIYRRLDSGRSAGLALVDLAEVLIAADRSEDAVVYLERASDLLAEVDDPYNKARVRTVLGRAHVASGKHESAAAELRASLEEMTDLGSSVGRANALEALGELSERSRRIVEARRRYEEALEALGETETAAHARIRFRLDRLPYL